LQDYPTPKEMTAEDITATKAEFVAAAKNGIKAGIDGVELHSKCLFTGRIYFAC